MYVTHLIFAEMSDHTSKLPLPAHAPYLLPCRELCAAQEKRNPWDFTASATFSDNTNLSSAPQYQFAGLV